MTIGRGRREEYSTLLLILNYIAVVVVALSVNALAEVQYLNEIVGGGRAVICSFVR